MSEPLYRRDEFGLFHPVETPKTEPEPKPSFDPSIDPRQTAVERRLRQMNTGADFDRAAGGLVRDLAAAWINDQDSRVLAVNHDETYEAYLAQRREAVEKAEMGES